MSTTTKQQPLLMRAAAMLLLAVLVLAAVPQRAGAQTPATIGGIVYNSVGGYYEIDEPDDLRDLATYVNGTGTYRDNSTETTAHNCSGLKFKMTQDITFTHDTDWDDATSTENNFVAIGCYYNDDDRDFEGDFDGAGHTISGIRIHRSGNSNANGDQGIFGRTWDANIHGLRLADTRITGYDRTGGIVGHNIGTVTDCHVASDVCIHAVQSSAYHHGGIAGYNVDGVDGTVGAVANCTSAATLTVPPSSNCKYYGAIAGYNNDGTLRDNLAIGATVPAAAGNTHGAIAGYNDVDGTLQRNYYTACKVAGVENATNVGCQNADVAANDGAVSVLTLNGNTYTISNTGGWNAFCYLLADNEKGYFSGKTVKLANNITVTWMAGGSNHDFTGTFDGQGHTLTVAYGSASAPLDAQFVAPFVEVRGDAEFFNLTIDGHIYAAYTGSDDSGVGGLIGHLFGGITIEGCTSTVEINSTKDRVGGFVGLCEHAVTFTNCKSSAVVTCTGSGSGFVGWSRASNVPYTIAFEGCLFNGKILQKNGVGSGNGGFVGWTGSTKTVTVTNSLVDPAAPAEGETMADDNSATFARGWSGTPTNSYYTTAFGREQGTQAYSISKGEYVTTLEISGEPTNSYPVSGLDYYSVGLKSGDVLYAAVNNVVSLTLGCTPPSGYHFTGYTATGGTLNGTTLTMPNGNVTIDATIEQLTPVDYVDENGEAQQCTDYILLTGTETYLGTPDHPDHETWYVVQGTLNYTKTLNLIGNTHIILADNAVMNGTGISPVFSGPSFSIYGQTGQSGELNVTSASQYALHVFGNITIAGGKVTASARYGILAEADGSVTIKNATVTATGTGTYNAVGIGTQGGDITIDNSNVTATAQGTDQCMAFRLQGGGNVIFRNGGKTRAEGGYRGIFCEGNVTIEGCQVEIYGGNYGIETNNITLGWTNPTDYIYANSYIDMQSDPITIATGKTFKTEDGHTYSGTIAMEYGTYPINGKTLYPNCVVMKQVEGYGDDNGGWVFIASPLAGSIAPSGVHNLIATTEEDYDLYRFNQSDPNGNEWQNWKATTEQNHPDFTELVNGQGYLYATKEDRTLVFAGEYTAGTEKTVDLVYDNTADLAGWNLVGNPFATPATMTDGNGQPIPFYVISGQNVVPYEGTTTTIERCTGVMVKANGTGEKVRFTSVSPDQAPQPNNGSLQIALSQVSSSLRGKSSTIDKAIVSFNEGSRLEKFVFNKELSKLYIPQGGTDYAIATSEGQGEMPLNFKAETDGTYTISVNVDNVEMGYLHLIDNMTGADVDLLAANGGDARHGDAINRVSTYTFSAKTTDYESRFKLVFSVGVPADGDNEAFAFIDASGNIIVNGEGTLQIVDMMGREIRSTDVTRNISTTGITPGIYVLRLIDGDTIRVQKIVVQTQP